MKKNQTGIRNILILVLAAVFFAGGTINNDIYFLLNNGRYLISHGIPVIDPFTIHDGLQYQMQQWLTCLIFWKTYQTGGYALLLILTAVLHTFNIWLIYRILLLESDSNKKLSLFLMAVAASMIVGYKTTRPFLFTEILLSLLILSTENFVKKNDWRWLLAFPVISVLQVNLHAAMWPMLLVFLLPYIPEMMFRSRLPENLRETFKRGWLIAGMAAIMAAGFLNPYGWKAMTYTLRAYDPQLQIVQEMQPPDIGTGLGMVIFISMAIIVSIVSVYWNRNHKLYQLFLILGTAYMALVSIRSWYFFLFAAVITLGGSLKEVKIFKREHRDDPDSGKKMLLNYVAMAFILAATTGVQIKERFGLDDSEGRLYGVTDWMGKNCSPDTMTLYNGFNEGGYLEFLGYKTYIDPRAELFLTGINQRENILGEFIRLNKGSVYYEEVLEKYSFTHLLIEKGNTILESYLPYDENWETAYEDENYVLFQRKL